MSFTTRKQAVASLREFVPWLRDAHIIVKFWSTKYNAYRYCRVLSGRV